MIISKKIDRVITALHYNFRAYSAPWGHWLLLQWRHNGRDSVSNHQPHHCFLNRLFRRRSKKTSKLRVTGLCQGISPGTGEFPLQMASNAENVSIWWRHHGPWDRVMLYGWCPSPAPLCIVVLVPSDTPLASPWWRHQMETFSVLLASWAGNSPVTGEFPAQRPVTRSFDVFYDLRLNQQLSKQWRRRWFEMPWRSLWHICNAKLLLPLSAAPILIGKSKLTYGSTKDVI